jgi:hypothetical protein
MKRLLVAGVMLAFAPVALADIYDNFDAYASQAEFDAVYGAGGMTLDQAKGYSDGQSMSNASRLHNWVDLDPGPAGYWASDDDPLTLSVMVDVDVLHWWTRSWILIYSYDALDELQDAVGVGFTSSLDQSKYHCRGGSYVWHDITDGSGDPVFDRNTEWRELKAVLKSTTIDFYVDGVLGITTAKPEGILYTDLVLGTSYSSQEDVWFDDLSLTGTWVPEPATLSMLAVGGLALVRRRRR